MRPAENLLAGRPWEFGPFVNGGFGTGNRGDYKFLWAGVHAGKVLTSPFGKGFLNGQFELGAELMPLWQAYTPKYLRANCYEQPGGPLTLQQPVSHWRHLYRGQRHAGHFALELP